MINKRSGRLGNKRRDTRYYRHSVQWYFTSSSVEGYGNTHTGHRVKLVTCSLVVQAYIGPDWYGSLNDPRIIQKR